MKMFRIAPALLLASVTLMLDSCAPDEVSGPLTMSVIGGPLHLADPNRSVLDSAPALLLSSTAQGLVAFDGEGQVEPALAERWVTTDDGLSYIFRIRRAKWANGRSVTSAEVAARLNEVFGAGGNSRLKPLFASVAGAISMTGQVVQIQMRAPQPNFLQILAQPELALFRTLPSQGTGPYKIHSIKAGVTRLRLIPETEDGEYIPDPESTDVRVRGEKASMGVARFAVRDIALVTGGGFNDIALARAANLPNSQFQLDPAYGLFGLAISADSVALGDSNIRRALAMAIDRERLVQLFGVNTWQTAVTILPNQLDSAARPAGPEWTQLNLEQRIARARGLVKGGLIVKLALPNGPGSRLLLAALAADWRRIGVTVQAVGPRDAADLRLIDEVAPQSSALWYLSRLSCGHDLPCSENGETALKAALSARTLDERANAIGEADAAFAGVQGYIPIALPLRWSLVSPQLVGWRPSAFAVHPLQHLRGGAN
jgi:oligopeptide transport system substrate-binding protein